MAPEPHGGPILMRPELDLVFGLQGVLVCDLTTPVLPSVRALNLTAPKEAPWLGK